MKYHCLPPKRRGHESNPLIELPDLDAEPSFVSATHICADDAGSDFLVEIAIPPSDSDRPRSQPGANESSSGKSIQIEAEPFLQASTMTWARHPTIFHWSTPGTI